VSPAISAPAIFFVTEYRGIVPRRKETQEFMVNCPLCDAPLDFDEDELDEGDELTCDECGEMVRVSSKVPLELEGVDDDDDDEDDEDEDDDEEDDDFEDGDDDFDDDEDGDDDEDWR
jgi:alpha-aminoadipate/glutamate carrier protein LysW